VPEDARIAVLPAALADQIAAGEVVERPASIVKELLDNAIDAGATRVEIELEQGGRESIRVIDDGRGIHGDDLVLALTRHATSKLRTPAQLIEIHTLGFRGEALASIAAVARVDLRSRMAGAVAGRRARALPGQLPTLEPIGMPFGTQVEVAQLFANVPARRKFLRSEATEIGHCIDAVIRVALVHPHVHVVVRHGARELLALPAADAATRVAQVLARAGASGPLHAFAGERAGVQVQGFFAPPEQAQRQRVAGFVVVRRRVVRDRTLGQLLRQAYGDALAADLHPAAVLFVEPPPGSVDVNVHPQKSEVRFADAQQLFASVRELVAEGLADAAWWRRQAVEPSDAGEAAGAVAPAWASARPSTSAALSSWAPYAIPPERTRGSHAGEGGGGGGVGYRLGTRALGRDYASDKQQLRSEAEALRASLGERRGWPSRASLGEEPRDDEPPRDEPEAAPLEQGPALIGQLPGPVALFEDRGTLVVVDLRRLRAHLVRTRLLRELAALPDRRIPAQGLLEPVVVRRRVDEHALLLRSRERLQALGVELEGFGEGAVVVRAVPALLRKVLDEDDVAGLIDRLLPWLRMHEHADAGPAASEVIVEAAASLAERRSVDTTPRLARAWLAEALREAPIDSIPGVRRWSASDLLG
jgi:DNA mismatch repair protein MutL